MSYKFVSHNPMDVSIYLTQDAYGVDVRINGCTVARFENEGQEFRVLSEAVQPQSVNTKTKAVPFVEVEDSWVFALNMDDLV